MAELLIAAAALAAALVFVVVERGRRARRLAAALERARRRHRPPLVSANLRGLAAGPDGDLWSGELREQSKAGQAAPRSHDD